MPCARSQSACASNGSIDADGRVYLEELEHNPAKYLPEVEAKLGSDVVEIDLNQPMKDILATLSKNPIKTRLSLTGTMIVARDSAHAKLRERLEKAGKKVRVVSAPCLEPQSRCAVRNGTRALGVAR